MKFTLYIAAAVGALGAPAYSHMSQIFERSGTLVTVFAPGAEPLFNDEQYEPDVIALAE